MKKNVTKVIQPEEKIPTEIMAESIVEISVAMKRISKGDLNEKALVILIAHATKLPQYEVENVLHALEDLEKLYLKRRNNEKGERYAI